MTRLSRRTTIAYSFGQLGSGLYGAFNNFTLSLYLYQFTEHVLASFPILEDGVPNWGSEFTHGMLDIIGHL